MRQKALTYRKKTWFMRQKALDREEEDLVYEVEGTRPCEKENLLYEVEGTHLQEEDLVYEAEDTRPRGRRLGL